LAALFQEHTVERMLWKWTRRVQKSRKTERVYALIAATCGSSGPIAVRLSTAVSDQIPIPASQSTRACPWFSAWGSSATFLHLPRTRL